MADSDDLELGSEEDHAGIGSSAARRATHPVRRRIPIKLREDGKSRAAASKKTAKTKSSRDAILDGDRASGGMDQENDTDVDKTMQFTSMKLGGTSGEPCHQNQKLKWDHKVNLLGEKIVDPLIHSCEKCTLPILIYGRMIPCKHVFCYSCAKASEKNCPRCNVSITRVEQAALGTVFVCTFGGTKHGVSGCHRTYLSQRDLQSHIAHRHFGAGRCEQPMPMPRPVPPDLMSGATAPVRPAPSATVLTYQPLIGDGGGMMFRPQQPPPAHSGQTMQQIVVTRPPPGLPHHLIAPPHGAHVIGSNQPGLPPGMMPSSHTQALPPPPPVSGMSGPPLLGPPPVRPTNLITVQLHDENEYRRSVEAQNASSRGSFVSQPPAAHDNPLSHFPQSHFPPPGPPVSFHQSQEHQHLGVRPMLAHPGAHPSVSSQLTMVTVGMAPAQMGPAPQRLGPPPHSLHSGPPPMPLHSGPLHGMHGGPPLHSGPPPGLSAPPQAIHAGPPPHLSGMRTGAQPTGYAARPQFPGDEQHGQFSTGQPPMAWPPNAGPGGASGQLLATPPSGSRPSSNPSQSMPYYQ